MDYRYFQSKFVYKYGVPPRVHAVSKDDLSYTLCGLDYGTWPEVQKPVTCRKCLGRIEEAKAKTGEEEK